MHKILVLFLMFNVASARADMPICGEFTGSFEQEMTQLDRLLGRLRWAATNDRGLGSPDCELFDSSSSSASSQLTYLKALDATICDIGSKYIRDAEENLTRMNEAAAPLCEAIRN